MFSIFVLIKLVVLFTNLLFVFIIIFRRDL